MTLCQLAADFRGTLPTGGAMAEQKHDGWRGLYFAGIDGKRRLWTRGGIPIEGIGHIAYRLDAMERAAGEAMLFDGEFQVDRTLAATKAWCETKWRFGGEAGIFHAFDCLTLAEWKAGGTPIPLYTRKARLRALWEAAQGDEWTWRPGSRGRDENAPSAVQIVEDEWVFTPREAVEAAQRVWAAGGEGVVIKDAEAGYSRSRNNTWLKVKQENFSKWRMAA